MASATPGLEIGMTVEVFQSLGIRPSPQDWLKNFRSLSLKEGEDLE